MLVKTTKNGQATTYTYDPLGRRISKTDTFGTTRYLWAGDQMVQEQRNSIKKTYIYEPENFRPVAQVVDEKVYHYHLDHLGTPRELTDDSGKVVWKVRYKTYGNVAVKEVEEVENNIRFQGQYFDEETGLHYNRFRYYNPNTGQFITQDPIGLLGGVNNYQYAPNPVGWVDPFGLSCKEVIPENYDPLTDSYKGVDLNFFSPKEGIHAYAKKVKNSEGIFVVGGHGSQFGMRNDTMPTVPTRMTPESLAKVIQNHPKYTEGMPVYLLSCNTGKGENSFAEQLSNVMKTEVIAPDELLWYYPDGSVRPYARDESNPQQPDLSKPGSIRRFKSKD